MVQTFEKETEELVRVTYDGDTITTTPTHPFYVPQKGWTSAIELRAGDMLVTVNGEYVVVEKIQHELLETPVTVYNFEVEDFHTYYVSADAINDGVLVHNKFGSQPKDLSPTNSGRRGAFNAAKQELGIPRSQQPIKVSKNVNRQGKIVPGRVYDFGDKIIIGDDIAGHIFSDGFSFGRHFNTPSGGHYFY